MRIINRCNVVVMLAVGALACTGIRPDNATGDEGELERLRAENAQLQSENATLKNRHDSDREFITGLSTNSVRAPFGRFLLLKRGNECVALRIIEHTRPVTDRQGSADYWRWNGAKYEWFLQADGSRDFSKPNVIKGSGEVYENRLGGANQNLYIQAGNVRVEWSLSDWIYFPRDSDTPVSMALTEWVRLADINAADKLLNWLSDEQNIAWGTPIRGLQLGARLISARRPHIRGETCGFEVLLRNVSDQPVTFTYFDIGFRPIITQSDGSYVMSMPAIFNRAVLRNLETLAPGKRLALGEALLKLGPPEPNATVASADLSPGEYRVTFPFNFVNAEVNTWSGDIQSGPIELKIAAPR